MRTTRDQICLATFERCAGALSREAGGQAAADTKRGPGKDQGENQGLDVLSGCIRLTYVI